MCERMYEKEFIGFEPCAFDMNEESTVFDLKKKIQKTNGMMTSKIAFTEPNNDDIKKVKIINNKLVVNNDTLKLKDFQNNVWYNM